MFGFWAKACCLLFFGGNPGPMIIAHTIRHKTASFSPKKLVFV